MKSTEITAFKSKDMSRWQTLCNGERTYLMWVKQTKTNNSKTSEVFQNTKEFSVNDNRTVGNWRGRKICRWVGDVAKVARRGTKHLGNHLLVRDVHVALL